jgi:AraC family transcriptional regulator
MRPGTRTFYEQAAQRAVERVVAGLDGELGLEALARGAALSPFHFHRLFRGLLGETPLAMHRRLRLERSAWCLLSQGGPVTAVAFAAGYETHEAFTRAFRASYGCAPSEFRRRWAPPAHSQGAPARIELPARSGIHYQHGASEVPRPRFTRGGETMKVEIEQRPALRVATVRHVGPYHLIVEAFSRLDGAAREGGLLGPEAALLGIYHDDPETTPAPQLRSDAGLVISRKAKVPAGLGELRLPAGRYARTRHRGSYRRLGDTWAQLMGEWLPGSGRRVGKGMAYEHYLNTPAEVPEAELVIDLYLPLATPSR